MPRSFRLALSLGCLLLLGCGESRTDVSYTNPDWRAGMKGSVSFPLPGEVTVTVGLSSSMPRPGEGNLSLQWLQAKTGIKLSFVGLPDSPGDVELGEMLRAGKLPDIVPEARIDLGDDLVRRLFVNVLEFPGLTPNFRARVKADAELRTGIAARSTEAGELYSLGSYRPDSVPYGGVLAYRRDVFKSEGLASSSWEEIARSLDELKRSHPLSTPFGGYFNTIIALMPSWFGSGYDPQNLLYFDTDRGQWVFGPEERGFRDFVAYLADLFRRGTFSSEVFVGQDDGTARMFLTDTAFMAPWKGGTGPFFPHVGSGYGALGENGEWNGEGSWVDALPLPPPPSGARARSSAAIFSRVGPGWLVYNQSPRASEALALLDFLYGDEASLVASLGPEGTAWERSAGKVSLTGELQAAYAQGGEDAVRSGLKERGVDAGIDLGGLAWSFSSAFGFPTAPAYAFHRRHDLALNRPGIELTLQPGIRIPDERSFDDARVGLIVSLTTAVESGVASFIAGRKDMGKYDAFVQELLAKGGTKLIELYRTRATLVDADALFAR